MEKRRYFVERNRRTGAIQVGTYASQSQHEGKGRVGVEMALDRSRKDGMDRLVELWVENTVSLDQALELLKRAPRSHNADMVEPNKSFSFAQTV